LQFGGVMPFRLTRSVVPGLGALLVACAPATPPRTPAAEDICAPLCPYEGQPPAERALLRLLEMYVGPMDLVNASGSAAIGVLYDDQPATWQAMVIEVELLRDTIVGKLPGCTPQNFTTIVGWHELTERSGVTGFSAWTPRLGATVPLEGFKQSGCWFRRPAAAGGWLARVVDTQVFPKNLYQAMSGDLAIDRPSSPVGKPCPTPTPTWTWVPHVSCRRLTYSASMSHGIFRVAHPVAGEDSLPLRVMEFQASNIPGIRLVIDCMDGGTSMAFMYCR
jgi:hypothetical protein